VTFSIAAYATSESLPPEWGIAVASKFLAVGSAVPWARAGVGAIATQALANLGYGRDGLHLLARGLPAADVVEKLTGADEGRDDRQLGVVDRDGVAATYTGSRCLDWAGGRTSDGYCCQGNILTGPDVVDAMADAFEGARGSLAPRLLAALSAGDAAGGDRRGRQSAALLVVREKGGYGGAIDRAVDLRVDDHARPVEEITRLLTLHELYFPRADELEWIDVDDVVAAELRSLLDARGYPSGASEGPYDAGLRDALFAYVGTENLEERWVEEPRIERRVLEHLRQDG
jgi:uncharacterized Ntn-hydrolase superfamily protein